MRPGSFGTRAVVVAVGAMTLGAVLGAAAQTPTFSARIETVRVDVLATDGRRPATGLQATDFEILDDGVAQSVEIATLQQIPVNVVLALDTSGSVSGERLEALRAASRAVTEQLAPGDKAALVAFSSVLAVRAGLATDAERVRAALDEPPLSGDTALFDATYAALVLAESDVGRALLIVLSDGADTASFLTPESVLETARRTDVVVYGVSVEAPGSTSFLRDLCDQTGGRVVRAGSNRDIARTFLDVLDEFRHRYLLRYVPQGVPQSGWHKLAVSVKRRGVHVQARPGYLAGR
jgi:Ca-activated chloride channel homolog